MRLQDISKIADVFRERKSEDKYSHVATLKEIRENDYNLNIPRYVDKFQAQEPVDLDAVAAQLQALDHEAESITNKIKVFAKSLEFKSHSNGNRLFTFHLRFSEFSKDWNETSWATSFLNVSGEWC